LKPKPSPNKNCSGKVQIIGGRWRRTLFPVANADGFRPTGSRVRETLFNWLTPYIHGARCLDLFAGTGSLGLEALSRGAQFVQFIDNNTQTLQALRGNLNKLNAAPTEFQIDRHDALKYLPQLHTKSVDIVFLDPPFQSQLWQPSIDLLSASKALSNDAIIYVERPRETKINAPAHWHEHRTLNAGRINATLYRTATSDT